MCGENSAERGGQEPSISCEEEKLQDQKDKISRLAGVESLMKLLCGELMEKCGPVAVFHYGN